MPWLDTTDRFTGGEEDQSVQEVAGNAGVGGDRVCAEYRRHLIVPLVHRLVEEELQAEQPLIAL